MSSGVETKFQLNIIEILAVPFSGLWMNRGLIEDEMNIFVHFV